MRLWWRCASLPRSLKHTFELLLNKGELSSDITTETEPVCGKQVGDKGVEDGDWKGCGLCGSHITPLKLFSTCHISTLSTQQ